MTTQIHDSNTCTAGLNGQPCVMCHFVREFEKSSAKSPSEPFQGQRRPSEGEKIDSTCPSASGIAISAPDFEREWLHAPRTHTRHTEQSEAEWWFQRGLWLGIQYERERGLVAVNGDLKEMQRIARERITK